MKNYYWKTKDGQKINIDDMDINHLRNALKMIIRNIEANEQKVKSRPKFQLNGDIAQDHFNQMQYKEYYDEVNLYDN
jgi:hypothetical protein